MCCVFVCVLCVLRFDGRGQVLEHIGKSGLCLLNLSRLPFLVPDRVLQLQASDAEARKSLIKSGWHKNKVAIPATRMLGPLFPVIGYDGLVVKSKNGHPLGDSFPWRRSHYFSGKIPRVPRLGCHASHFMPCTPQCIVCRGGSRQPVPIFA